jgi:hypothetical protein
MFAFIAFASNFCGITENHPLLFDQQAGTALVVSGQDVSAGVDIEGMLQAFAGCQRDLGIQVHDTAGSGPQDSGSLDRRVAARLDILHADTATRGVDGLRMPADGIGQHGQQLHGRLIGRFDKGLRSRYTRHPHNRPRGVDAIGIADIVITFYNGRPEHLDPGGGEHQRPRHRQRELMRGQPLCRPTIQPRWPHR